MINNLGDFATRRSLISWLALCVTAPMLILVIYDWRAEAQAWIALRVAGFPIWGIIGGIAVGWLMNSVFWAWIVLAAGAGWMFRRSAQLKKSN